MLYHNCNFFSMASLLGEIRPVGIEKKEFEERDEYKESAFLKVSRLPTFPTEK